jgi:hypothetical protein
MSQHLTFQKITGTDEQIYSLYKILKCKQHNISHKDLPSYEEHKNFVFNHPYRAWYLIKSQDECVGSVYLLKDNCIGLFLLEPSGDAVKKVLFFVLKKHKPLVAKKSIRAKDFFINVSPTNKELATALEQCMAKVIQVSYSIDEKVVSLVKSEQKPHTLNEVKR